MLKGYTPEQSPESRIFREVSAATVDGTMVFDVFSATNFETRHFPAYPTDSNCHNLLDDRGGNGILAAARMACSPALLAFGGDSAIELFSAIVVLWRFRAHADQEQSEKHAARIAALLLFTLAAYVTVVSVLTLVGYSEPKTTYMGIAIFDRGSCDHALACQGKA
jgi:hypothetical protein